MSEKQVNIKITASTKDFNNAIDKAQKQIENLAEVIDKLSSSKFGDKLEEQFDGLVKTIKKIEEQMTDMMDSLNDLGKAKFDKIEDQFKDIVDSGKDVNEKIEDILDLLDTVDRQDLNGLEKEFDQVRDSLEQLSKETRESTDTMEKNFRDITDEVDKFIRELNNVEDTKLENLEESIKDLDKYVDEAAESVDDFNKKTNDLDDKELNDYLDSLIDITRAGDDARDALKKAFGSLDGKSGKLDFDLSGKGKDGALSSIAEGLISGTVAGNKLEKAMEDVADSISDVAKNMEKLDDAIDTKSIDELGEEYRDAENAMEKLTEEYDDLIKKQKELNDNKLDMESRNNEYKKTIQPLLDAYEETQKAVKDVRDQLEEEMNLTKEYNQAKEEMRQKLLDVTKAIEEQKKAYSESEDVVVDAEAKYNDLRRTLDVLNKEYDELREAIANAHKAGDGETTERLTKDWIELGKTIQDVTEQIKEVDKVLEDTDDKQTAILDRIDALEEEKRLYSQTAKELEEFSKNIAMTEERYKDLNKQVEEFEKRASDIAKTVKDLKGVDITLDEELETLKKEMLETEEAAEGLADEINDVAKAMADMNKVAQGHADEFDKQYKAYEKLSKRVKEYLENEENGILLREKVAKSFKQVADSMEAVYKDSSKLSNFDLVNKTLEEAAEHIKDLNLVSTENLQADLNRLGEIIEDKTEKIKRFKELNKEFGSDASKAAAGLDKQAKDIRDWANSADFAIEAADKLTHAWGDLSAAGEDHLKIRERSKYIDDFGKTLEENIAHIKNYYHELETLDDIYKECTDKQRATIDDYKMWEKNKEKLLEYNRAINEYMRTLRDTGGQIDAKFLDELGNFSPQKFIDNFEKMGASSIVLSKQINAVKIELIESIKQYKENAEAARENAEQAVRNAKAALDEAKANQKNADSQEEYLEATERVKKAQQELAEAKKKAKNYDDETLKNLKDQIQEYNRLAAAMREIGMAAQDLGKADIEKFNKSLASMLDRIDTFENDLPKSFADIKEDIKAVFADMDSLDFGGVFDGLKDIGAGLLGKLPTELKVAAAAALALGAALKKCAEIGINQFTRGMETVGNALSSIVGVARDVGQEVRDAFENITGMQMDFSSLMEIPVNFESMMAEVGAIAGVTGDAFDELEDKARELGATTRYSAYEVAEAMKYMGMAGWDNKEIMAGLESVLNLATVANMDLGQASDFVTDGLTALGMEAKDAAYMVDILAAASTSSNTTVAQMQRAFTNCAPVAGTLGINIKDLSMALGLMADKGVKGAKAGTAMKNLMANLSAPTEKQLEYIKAFNLEGAQQDIVNGRLIDGIKKMKAALSKLTPQQQNAVITTIAGKEALSGISALLNTTEEDLAELESALDGCSGSAQEMADNFDNTLKGALKGLASAMQETLLQVFDKTEESIKSVTKELTEFFHTLNGFSDYNGVKGLAGALEYLEEVSQGWGQAIADNLEKAINSIDDFLNSASFDNLLQVGTNIINGIADGIKRAADDGSLDSAISTAIGKIATWFSDNLETVIDVGKEIIDAISDGISENGPAIGKAIRAVMDLQTEIDKAVAKEKWKLIGDNLVSFICEGIESKVSVFISALSGFFSTGVTEALGKLGDLFISTGSTMLFDPIMALGKKIGEWLRDAILDHFDINLDGVFSSIGDKISSILPWGKDKNKSSGSSKGSTGKAPSIDTSKSPIDIINSNLSSGKNKTDATAASIGEGISSNITSKLETMDAGELSALGVEMQNLQRTVTSLAAGMGASFTAIQDSARTSFMGLTNIVRNQLVSVTNIMRNQMVNSANIVRNQCLNMANIFRNQFVSMANVTRNQMLNVSNIIRNQAVNWANIISNQSKNARDNLTRQFISMAKVVATQMKNCLSSVESYMSKIAKATNKKMTMNLNVNRTVSTSYAAAAGASVASADALYAANTASTYSLGRNMSALASRASSVSSSSVSSSSNGRSSNDGLILEMPVYLDGKEVARATAKYVDGELKRIASRENRKRGAK